MDPWKELKQITSVEYSWSEHINVGEEDIKTMEAMMMNKDVDIYDLLNEINEYYDYYSNHAKMDDLMKNDANGTKSKMSDMLMSKMKFDEEMENSISTTYAPISGEEVYDDMDMTTIPTLFPEVKMNELDKDISTVPTPPFLSSSHASSSKSSEDNPSTESVITVSSKENLSTISSTATTTPFQVKNMNLVIIRFIYGQSKNSFRCIPLIIKEFTK